MMESNAFRDYLYSLTPSTAPADQKAFVDEVERRLQIAIAPNNSRVKTTVLQDESDTDHIRLTNQQASTLLNAPGVSTLKGLRDTAFIAVMLCTGLRVFEVVNLKVDDLAHHMGGELVLCVRQGKGNKQRLVPYGDLDWCFALVRVWMQHAGITDGAVFRSFWKGSKRVRDTAITTRSIERVLAQYPVTIDGELRTLEPHDLRRTYARLMYEADVKPIAIKQNLGHASLTTTLRYIGELKANQRRAPSMYTFDIQGLSKIKINP
jgi:site-specific recombinase XerD